MANQEILTPVVSTIFTDNHPTHGPIEPVPSWEEYDHIRDAVERFYPHKFVLIKMGNYYTSQY